MMKPWNVPGGRFDHPGCPLPEYSRAQWARRAPSFQFDLAVARDACSVPIWDCDDELLHDTAMDVLVSAERMFRWEPENWTVSDLPWLLLRFSEEVEHARGLLDAPGPDYRCQALRAVLATKVVTLDDVLSHPDAIIRMIGVLFADEYQVPA